MIDVKKIEESLKKSWKEQMIETVLYRYSVYYSYTKTKEIDGNTKLYDLTQKEHH